MYSRRVHSSSCSRTCGTAHSPRFRSLPALLRLGPPWVLIFEFLGHFATSALMKSKNAPSPKSENEEMSLYLYKTAPNILSEQERRSAVASRHNYRLQLQRAAAELGRAVGQREAARRLGLSHQLIGYYMRKQAQPGFHPGPHGGRREEQMAFGSFENDLLVQEVVYMAILADPDASFKELLTSLQSVPGLENMSPPWLSRTLKSWGWNWGRVRLLARHKFTPENIAEMADFAIRITKIPLVQVRCRHSLIFFLPALRCLVQLLFVDEARIISKKLGRLRKIGRRGDGDRIIIDRRPNEIRLNVILMTSLVDRNSPLYFEIMPGTITAEIFRNFVARAAVLGHIPNGATVIWDNARVHLEAETINQIDEVVQMCGARRVNLPKYSPEFNPCEMVFAEIKCFMRNNRRPGWSLHDRLVEALDNVSWEHVLHYYEHCSSVGYRILDGQ